MPSLQYQDRQAIVLLFVFSSLLFHLYSRGFESCWHAIPSLSILSLIVVLDCYCPSTIILFLPFRTRRFFSIKTLSTSRGLHLHTTNSFPDSSRTTNYTTTFVYGKLAKRFSKFSWLNTQTQPKWHTQSHSSPLCSSQAHELTWRSRTHFPSALQPILTLSNLRSIIR
jgi:hypothetical protein